MYALLVSLHVLGATVWTGGHLVLALGVLPRALRARDPDRLREFERIYEPIGLSALAVQIVTGLALAHRYLPDVWRWVIVDSFISAHVLVKILLLGATVAVAAHARLRVIPRLGANNLWAMAWHIIAVTVMAVLLVLVGVGLRTGGF
jgi:putative copper export protein